MHRRRWAKGADRARRAAVFMPLFFSTSAVPVFAASADEGLEGASATADPSSNAFS
jgi:hypothetical protein